MERAAESGQGSFTYINNQSDIARAISDLFYKLKNPIMTNISIDFQNTNAEIFPKKSPDLYAGEPIIISAKIPSQSNTNKTVTIKGTLNNALFNQNIQISNNKESKSISKLWARSKLKNLYFDERKVGTRNTAKNEVIKQEITKLAIQHQLLSKYTSFLAIEDIVSRPKNALLLKNKIPNAMPEGSTQSIPMNNSVSNPLTIAMPSGGLGILGLWYMFISCLSCVIAMHFKTIKNRLLF